MLGFGVSPTPTRAPHWRKWLKLIIKSGALMELRKVAIIPDTGLKCFNSKGFTLSEEDVMVVAHCFQSKEPPELFRVSGCTYCVKSACPEQVVAFNGGRYLIVSKTRSVTVVAVCERRDKLSVAATWLLRIASTIN